MKRTRFWLASLVAVGLTAGAGTIASPPAQAALFGISESQEKQIGSQAAQQLESQYGVSKDRKQTEMIQTIGSKLARVSDRPKLDWHFKVLNAKDLNAVSLPGGYVYVFKGLMDAVGSDRQMLAGVIGHEVGHVSAHHHTKMMQKQMASSAIIGLLLKGKTQNLAGMFTNVYALKWSRNDEYQADELGVRYASEAGYDPYGLPHFLQVLEKKYGGGSKSGPSAWLASHPATGERIKRAFAYADEDSGGSRNPRNSRSRSNDNPREYDKGNSATYEEIGPR